MNYKQCIKAFHIRRSTVLLALSLITVLAAAFPAVAQSSQPDILFQNKTTGQLVDWMMHGTTLVNYAFLPDPGSKNWTVVGSGDFTGDGKPDLLFQNQQTGQLIYWQMNGTAFVRYGLINPSLPGPIDWKVVAVADFTRDHQPDILFQNQTTGQLVYWAMNGTTLDSYGFLPDPGSPNWKVVGAGDLDGDGNPDILFQNQQTGQLVYWILHGTAFVRYGYLADPGSSSWKVVGIIDFNNDNKPDILFQNQTTGQLVYWLMNGTTLITYGFLPDPGSPDWKVVVLWAPQNGGGLPQPVSWWKAENNVVDSLGGNSGSASGGITFGTGESGQAFLFNGIDGAIFVADAANLHLPKSFTIDVWINVVAIPSRNDNYGMIFMRGDDRPGLDPFFLGMQYDGNLHFAFDSATNQRAELAVPVALGRWVHVTATLDDSNGHMQLFLDGQLAASLTTSLRPLSDLDPTAHPGVGIGNSQNPSGVNYPFNGGIDELKIYNTVVLP